MLKTTDRALREMAAFALGRLAQNTDNQAGIFAMGVLPPLLDLLTSKVKNLEHNAAFTLYGLADNPDNVPEIVKRGGYERLRLAKFPDDQPTKDCIVKTMKRIAEKVQGTDFIKEHLMQLLTSKVAGMKQRMAVCLAHLLQGEDIAKAYSSYGGATVLLDLVCDADTANNRPQEWAQAIEALQKVVLVCQEREKEKSLAFVPEPPEDEKLFLGTGFVNNARLHDVVFVVEGKPFYAHKIALTAKSATFHAMFDSDCMEGAGGVPTITIPHISHDVFELMVAFLYTQELPENIDAGLLPQLLEVADQYFLDSLTAACAARMARDLSVDTVVDQYTLAMQFNAKELAHAAVAFVVTNYEDVEKNFEIQGVERDIGSLLVQLRDVLEEYLERYLWCSGEASPRDTSTPVSPSAAAQDRPIVVAIE